VEEDGYGDDEGDGGGPNPLNVQAAKGGVSIPCVNGKTYYERKGLPKRPPIGKCTEKEFIADVKAFLATKGDRAMKALVEEEDHVEEDDGGKETLSSSFPDAVVNGSQLDLWTLYKEVVKGGGFRIGQNVNWKGVVFRNMKNYSEEAGIKMTGVGNALKRHYVRYVLDYEDCHPEDCS
jgi:hypothetical protein